jgi:hypothetical protein
MREVPMRYARSDNAIAIDGSPAFGVLVTAASQLTTAEPEIDRRRQDRMDGNPTAGPWSAPRAEISST